jgi:large repetitive protein
VHHSRSFLRILCCWIFLACSLAAQDDPTDPFILAQASALSNNPNQIFAFVRDQIGVEIYAGSVRGARGTLWSRSGNSLDRASLLVALLRAAGQSARYVQGQLGYQDATSIALVNRIYPFRSRIIGCLPPNSASYNPIADGTLFNEAREYYWVEFGASNTPLDPNLATNTFGQTLVTPLTRFTSVPTNLRQQITLRLKAEFYPLANGLFALGTNTNTVLTQTYFASELVGKPISVGNFVTSTGLGALVFSSATINYTPYFFLGQGGPDLSQDSVSTGQSFQETYTNFPLGSTVLTGLFLEVDALDETYTQRTYVRTIYDRLGPAARSGLSPTNVAISGMPVPALTDFDIVTVNALPGLQSLPAFSNQQTRLANARSAFAAIASQVSALPTSGDLTPAQQDLAQRAATLQRYIVIALNELIAMGYNGASDAYLQQLQQGYGVVANYNSPRLTLAVSSFADGNASFRLDLLKTNVRYTPVYGNNRDRVAYWADVNRGILESHLEASVLAQVTGQPAIGIGQIFGALGDPNLLTVISQQNLKTLDSTTLSANAKALITLAVNAGRVVLTPRRMVTVNGVTTVGWLETAPNGRTISTFEDGGHQAIASYAGVQVTVTKYNQRTAQFIGRVEGIGAAGFAFSAGILGGIANSTSYAQLLKAGKTQVGGIDTGAPDLVQEFWKKTGEVLEKLKKSLPDPVDQGFSLIDAYAGGLKEGIEFAQKFLQATLPMDPPMLPFVGALAGPGLPGSNPGSQPGVQTSLALDTLFTTDVNGTQLPVNYRARVTNTGPTLQTFRLSATPSANYNIFTPVDLVTIPAGGTVETSVCVRPWDGIVIGPVGSPQPVSVTATSLANSSITSTSNATFNNPAVSSLQISSDPPVLFGSPGATLPVRLTIGALGNAPTGPVTLTASIPGGVNLTGLSSPLNLSQLTTATQNLSITLPANATPNTSLKIGIAASFSSAGVSQTVLFNLPVSVVAVGQCALESATNASLVGRSNLAPFLHQLAIDMNASLSAPSDPQLQARVVSDADALLAQLNAPFLTPLVPAFTSARNAIAAANASTLAGALGALNTALCDLRNTLATASNFQIRTFLTPSNQTTGPNLPVTYGIAVFNDGPNLTTYDLSVTGVPPGVNATINPSSLVLGPFGSTFAANFNSTLTLTPGASLTAPFNFNVVVTPRGAPSYAKSAPGALNVRNEIVGVDAVTATPGIVSPGASIVVSARIFSAVNIPRSANFSATIVNSSGQTVTFPFGFTPLSLTTNSSLQTLTLPSFTLPGNLGNGVYSVVITGFDPSGTPILGASGSGSLIIGAPFNAILSANPSSVPPGNSTVQARLTLNRDNIPNPISTLLGTIAVTGAPKSLALFTNGPQLLAYVCSDRVINIVDVTNSTSPAALGTFGAAQLSPSGVSGFVGVGCTITGNTLVVGYSRENGNNTANVIPTNFATYSLSNPLSPSLIGTSSIQRSDIFGLNASGATAFGANTGVLFNPFSNFIFQQYGDILALDFTNAATTGSITTLSTLFPPPGGDPNRGGPRSIRDFVSVNSTRMLAASSSSEDGNVQAPGIPPIVGQLMVVDTSNPSALSLVRRVDVPQTAFLTGVAFLGNTAIVVGDNGGVFDVNSGLLGNVVIASFDITDPSNPILRNTVVTQLRSRDGARIVPLTNNTFAIGGTQLSPTQPVLVLVDASNPSALRYVPYNTSFVSNPVLSRGTFFYSLSSNSLGIFQLSTLNGPQVSVSLNIPKTNGVALVPNSFSQTPSAVTTGTTFDTYRWDQPSNDLLTFNLNLTGMSAGDIRPIVQGGSVAFTVPGFGPGTINLPPLTVLTEQIMTITPDSGFVQAGSPSNFSVSLRNPTAQAQTFSLAALGLPPSWFTFPAPIVIAAGGTSTFNVTVTPAANANGGGFGRIFPFSVVATSLTGITASAGANINVLDGSNVGPDTAPRVFSFTATPNQTPVTAGRGSTATINVTIVNTGDTIFNVAPDPIPNLPAGWNVTVSANSVSLPPGANNSRVLTYSFQVPANAPIALVPLTLPIRIPFSTNVVNVNAGVNVVANGVTISLNPGTGSAGTVYQAAIVNRGATTDTFNLAPVGPLAGLTALNASSVTLNPGATATVNVLVSDISQNLPGTFPIQVQATSQAVPSVFAVASANLIVPATKGILASLTPGSSTINPAPGSVQLSLNALSTGNQTDSYTAAITGTTGPVTATLTGPSGAGPSISSFSLPALGAAAFPATANLTASGQGSVTVRITSLSDPTVQSTNTATIQSPAAQQPPTVSAGANRNIPLRRLALLDGSATVDPNTPALPITYTWTLTSAPTNSSVTTASIQFADQARASFRPDLPGAYVFQLTAANSANSASASVTYTAQNFTPVALAGNQPASRSATRVNSIAWLSGVESHDPDGSPITYLWTLLSAPSGSAVNTAAIRNSSMPRAWFRPDVPGDYQFQLVVNDGVLISTPALLTVTAVAAAANIPPASNAGLDLAGRTGTLVSLSGTASNDPDNSPQPLTYVWTFVQVPPGSTVGNGSLLQSSTATPSFTPDRAGDYVLNLRVSDGSAISDSTVTVRVNSFNAPPISRLTVAPFFRPNTPAVLDGATSSDPDSGPVTLAFLSWLNSIPSQSTATLQNATNNNPTFTPDRAGFFIVRQEAHDRLLGGFANAWTTVAAACDADASGIVTTLDIELINAALGVTPLLNDPRDGNSDGRIDAADVSFCTALLPPADRPNLIAAPDSLSFQSTIGTAPEARTVAIASSGVAQDFTAASNQPWLIVAPTAGNTGASTNTLNVSINMQGLAAQSYSGRIRLTSPTAGNSPLDIPVSLTISALTPLTVSTAPTGRTFTINGTSYSSSQTLQFAPGSNVAVATTTPQTTTGTRHEFASWSNGGAIAQSVAIGASPLMLTANFNTLFQLTHATAGSGQGSVTPASGLFFPSGSQQTLNATPGTCSVLGSFSSNAPGGTVTMSQPQAVTVTFNDNTAALSGTLSAAGVASGPVRIAFAGDRRITGTNRWRRSFNVTNTGQPLSNAVLAIDAPFTNVTSVFTSSGVTACVSPLGSAFLTIGNLPTAVTVSVTVEVVTADPVAPWRANFRVLTGGKP